MLITSTLDLSATLGLIVTATFNCKGTGADFLALGGLGAPGAPPTTLRRPPVTAPPTHSRSRRRPGSRRAAHSGTLPRTGFERRLAPRSRGGAVDGRFVRPEGDEPALRRGAVTQLLDRIRRGELVAGRPNGRPAARPGAHCRANRCRVQVPPDRGCTARADLLERASRTWGKDAPINSAGALPAHLSHEGALSMHRPKFGSVLAAAAVAMAAVVPIFVASPAGAANQCDGGEFPSTFAAQSGMKVACHTDAGTTANHIDVHDAPNVEYHHAAARNVSLAGPGAPTSRRSRRTARC